MEEIQISFEQIFNDPDFSQGLNYIRDCRYAKLPENWNYNRMSTVSTNRMEENMKVMGRCQVAWVINSELDFALTNQIRLVLEDRDNVDRQSFRDIDEALNWLGVPANIDPKELEPV